MLSYLLYGLFILACVVLVVVILLQPGKADAGALFSSSVSSTAFGATWYGEHSSKITIGAAASFMLIALMLSLPAVTGSHSVLQSVDEDVLPTPTPQASPAETASPTASPAENASPATSPQSSPAKPESKASPK